MAINKIKFEQLDINFSGLVFSGTTGLYVGTGAFSNFTGTALTSGSLNQIRPVYLTGNQTISGVKNFLSRPTFSGSGLALTGEGVQLSGAQTIFGRKTFSGGLQIGPPQTPGNNSIEILNQAGTNPVTINGSLIRFTGNNTFQFDDGSFTNFSNLFNDRYVSLTTNQTISGNKTFTAGNVVFTGNAVNHSVKPNVNGFPVALGSDLVDFNDGLINVSGLYGVDFRVRDSSQQNLIQNYALTAPLSALNNYVGAANFYFHGLYFFDGETGKNANSPSDIKTNNYSFDESYDTAFAIETISSPSTGKASTQQSLYGVPFSEVCRGVQVAKLRAGRNRRLEIVGSNEKNGSILIKFNEMPAFAFVNSGQHLFYRSSTNPTFMTPTHPIFENANVGSWTGLYSGTGYTSTGVGLIVVDSSFITGKWSGVTGLSSSNRSRLSAFIPCNSIPTASPAIVIGSGDGNFDFTPSDMGTKSLGLPHIPWGQICAVTNQINISDRNQKTLISGVSDELLDAWGDINYSQYKFSSSVREKGSGARWHIGLIAQDIDEAFKAKNLDAFEVGIIGKDIIPPVINENNIMTSPPMEVWSIRPDECQFMELAYLRRELNKLKSGTNG